MMKLVVVGAHGRMGQTVLVAAQQHPQFHIAHAIDRDGDARQAFAAGDVVIDFTAPAASVEYAQIAAQVGIPIVIGTTGLSEGQMRQLQTAAGRVAVVYSPNLSVGVHLFWHVAQTLAATCGPAYHLAIEETHHIHKIDAPSGTAKHLHALVAHAAQRTPASIPVVAHREGEVIGDHALTCEGTGDCITITHHAKTRAIFADGALVAAAWTIGKPAGWYGMDDVLGLARAVR